MAFTGKKGVGIPLILLHDAEGGSIYIELKSGDTYRGILDEAEDNMNCILKNCIKVSFKDKQQSQIDTVYIRGSQIIFIALPDMLSKAPMFNRRTVNQSQFKRTRPEDSAGR